MSKRTLHPAFGYVIARNEFAQSETLVVDTTAPVRSHIFYTAGQFTWADAATNAHAIDCNVGLFIPGSESPVGVFKGEAISDGSVFYCVDPKLNRDYLPDVQAVTISGAHAFPAKTKLFLCSGTVVVKGKAITAPAQIKLHSDADVISAGGVAYGLLF